MGWLVAVISGLLAGLSHPGRFGSYLMPDLGFLAFICWVPLFQVVAGARVRRAFGLSFLAGLLHFIVTQFWLYRAVHTFGGLPSITAFLVMCLLMVALSAVFGSIFALSQFASQRLKIPVFYIRAFFWVGIEFLRHYGPAGGNPWSQLGYTQTGFLTFIQSADIVGAFGITFFLVLINEVISLIVTRVRKREGPALKWPLGIVLVLLALNLSYGWYRLHQLPPKPIGEIKMGIVQANIPQEEKWQRGKSKQILQRFITASQGLEAQGAELILWPEASLPFLVAFDRPRLPFSLELESSSVLLGTISRSGKRARSKGERKVYNSALLLNHNGEILDYYHKAKLVPFGEYVPYRKLLFFVDKFVAEVGDFQVGPELRPVRFQDYELGVLICWAMIMSGEQEPAWNLSDLRSNI